MKYTIVYGNCCENLADRVNDALEDGWEISGSAYATGAGHFQPMTTEMHSGPLKCVRGDCSEDAAPDSNYCEPHTPSFN